MANDGFIEFLSSDALSEIDKAIARVDVLASKVKEVNAAVKGGITPSGVDNSLKSMNAAYREQANALKLAKQETDNYYNSIIKSNNAKKSNLSLSEAEARATNRATAEANKQVLANKKLNDAFVQLNNRRNEAATYLKHLIASEKANNAEIRRAQKEFDVLDGKVRKANQAVGNFSNNVGNYKSALAGASNLMSAFGIATGAYLAVDIVKNIYETTKQLQSLDLALKMVSETQETYGSNTQFIQDISAKWGIEIKGLTEQFTQFYVNAKGKLSETDIKTTFEGIAKAGSLMGISIDKQNDAFYAFNQMLSKGTVQAEELKKQLGNALPGAIKAATMAYQELNPNLKVTEQMMLDQMKAGNLVSDKMVPAIIRAYQKLYGIETVNSVNTLAAAQNRLSNSWTALIRNINESETGGLSKFFGYFITAGTNALNILIRLNSSWSELQNKTEKSGAEFGANLFAQFAKGKSKEEIQAAMEEQSAIMNFEMRKAMRKVMDLQKEIKEEQDGLNTLNPMGVFSVFNVNNKNEEILKLRNDIAQAEGYLKAYDDFLSKRSTKKVSPVAVGESEEQRKEREKAEKKAAKRQEELSRSAYERRISDLEREKEQIKDLRDLETTSLEDKLFLENAFATKQIEINQTIYKEKKRLAEGNLDLEKIALNELLTSNENALSESLERQNKLKEDALKSDAQKTKDWYEKNPPMFFMTDEMRKQYYEAQKKIQELKDEFRNYIQSFGQDFFSNAGFSETFDFFLRMDKDGKTMFDKLGKLADGSVEKFVATFQAISETAQEAFNFISEASQANFDAEYSRLEQQKEVALMFAGDSASAREEIERQYEQRRKGIARREAQARKQQAIFNIAIDTAQGIMSAVSKSPLTGGLPWSAIVAAIGAAQIAMVSSQQIPQYWKGTDNAEGGLAWTQERGREIITDSQGRVKSTGSDKGAELTMLAKGDKVFTAEKSAMMFDNSLNGMLLNNGIVMPKVEVSLDAEKITNEIKSLANTIANKEGLTIIEDERGKRKFIRKQNETKELLNNVLTYKSNNV